MTFKALFEIRNQVFYLERKIDVYCQSSVCDMNKACDLISRKLSLIKIYYSYFERLADSKKGRRMLVLMHYRYNKKYNMSKLLEHFKNLKTSARSIMRIEALDIDHWLKVGYKNS